MSVQSNSEIKRKFTKVNDFIFTAHHEAGHTIYALLTYMWVNEVLIFENKKTKRVDGLCYLNPIIHPDLIKDYELKNIIITYDICVSYAGLLAEKIFFQKASGCKKFPAHLKEGSSNDTSSASYVIRKYKLIPAGKQRIIYKKNLLKITSLKLEEHWDSVTLVAHQLFQKKKLSFSDLEKILSPNKFWKLHFKKIKSLFKRKHSEVKIKSIIQ